MSTRTYPTVYLAYPTPSLIVSKVFDNPLTCSGSTTQIPLPKESTTHFIFPSTGTEPTPGLDYVFNALDQLPIVTSLLQGDPRTCFHGAPTTAFLTTPVTGFVPIEHTTVSVLTFVGRTVTMEPPPGFGTDVPGGTGKTDPTGNGGGTSPVNGGDPPANTGGSGGSPTGPGQSQVDGGNTPTANPGSGNNGNGNGNSGGTTISFNGATITPAPSGGIVVGGQTITQGGQGTLTNGVTVSVGSGGVVVVGGSSVTLPSGTSSGTGSSSSATGPGAAIASGIGADKNNAFKGDKVGIFTFEAGILAVMLGGLGVL